MTVVSEGYTLRHGHSGAGPLRVEKVRSEGDRIHLNMAFPVTKHYLRPWGCHYAAVNALRVNVAQISISP